MNSAQQTLSRVRQIENYPAPLSDRGKGFMNKTKLAALAGRTASQYLTALHKPPQWMFKSYFSGLGSADIDAFADVRKVKSKQILSGLNFGGIADIANTRILNFSKGCKTQCDYCYALSGGKIVYMPWVWVTELAAKLMPTTHDVNFDGDALRNYHDPLYDKDFGDVAKLFAFKRISTSGFEQGSLGERAARKIASQRERHCIAVNFSLLSGWARELGRDGYVRTMQNVLSVLSPDEVIVFHNGVNFKESERALLDAGGDRKTAVFALPHREGRAKQMPESFTQMQQSGSILTRNVLILDPDGTIKFGLRDGSEHKLITIRRPGESFENDIRLPKIYAQIISGPFFSFIEHLV